MMLADDCRKQALSLIDLRCELALPGKLQGLDGRASRPGGIAIGYHMNRNCGLLLALGRHCGTDLI